MAGIKIKDAPLVEQLKETDKLPVSDGSDTAKATSIKLIKDLISTTGSQGPAGKSAYQIAVDNGFTGTESEWLISLKGKDGTSGPKGDKGDTGAVGKTGIQGPTGAKGLDGVSPHIGENGNWFVGTDDTGVKAQGPQGKPGEGGSGGGLGKKDENTKNFPYGTPESKKNLFKGEIFNLTEDVALSLGQMAYSNQAIGTASHAEGCTTEASGDYSHAEGKNTITSGSISHAEGLYTTASGSYSHSEGNNTTAKGNSSHAEGNHTKAEGQLSHAEGNYTKATNTNSHAEGDYTIASGVGSHAEGERTEASGLCSHAQGCHTIAENYSQTSLGIYNLPETSPSPESFNSSKVLLSVGNGDWNNKSDALRMLGNGTMWISGIGNFNGKNPTPENSLQAILNSGGSGGSGGSGVGKVDTTPDATNHGEIFNDYKNNKATGLHSHAEGWRATASGDYSHAEGRYTTADKNASHAEGWKTTASGFNSHAEGSYTTASGVDSHSEGSATKASGDYSHAQNRVTTANGFSQTVIGYKNIPEPIPSVDTFDATKLAFVVGGGSPTENKNVFEVYFNGTTKATGTITGATADYAEMFEWIDNNPLGTDRIGRFVNLVGKKIELATKDSKNIIGIISGNPVVLGDAPNSWQGMYINDKWGRPTYTNHEFEVERQKFNKETGKIEKVKEIKKSHARSINQRYDSSLVYTPREERSEWAAVGMLGKLLVLQDGTLNVGDYCYPSQDGIATKSEKGWYVMDVIDKEQALILYK